MRRSVRLSRLFLAALAAALCLAVLVPSAVFAADASWGEMRPDKISLNSKFPTVTGAADTRFLFEIELQYDLTDLDPLMGDYDTGRLQRRVFDIELSSPPGWEVFVAESSWKLDTRISSISLQALGLKQSLVVAAYAPYWENPAPGDYPIEVSVTSGELNASTVLTAKVTAWYGLDAATGNGRLNVKTGSGQPVTLDLVVANTGRAVVDDVILASTRPTGIANQNWTVKYEPESIESLQPGEERNVVVVITPPAKAISGDYTVTLNIDGKPTLSQSAPSLDIRVSVATRLPWLVTGLLLVLATVGGLVYAFTAVRRR